ncbi:hypothetical protein [Streptomyces yerevanensis]|uniref:hypothetical protein n=1 Tax=Streptomyces yerevanensis TaxID=66378 RepID=UPI000524FB26|nr:hypothetical protein [Streptomyces yerevanensis]
MSPALSDALDSTARIKGMTASQVVRVALGEYIAKEIRLSNERRQDELELSNQRKPAVELSNAVQGDMGTVAGDGITDADLTAAWGRSYDRKGR